MKNIELVLRENWKQIVLLVVINAFVGGMAGLERSILPEIAEKDFDMVAKTAILSFIVVFGITKAITNYYAGVFASGGRVAQAAQLLVDNGLRSKCLCGGTFGWE